MLKNQQQPDEIGVINIFFVFFAIKINFSAINFYFALNLFMVRIFCVHNFRMRNILCCVE